MNIDLNEETKTLSVDSDTVRRLTQGTDFQRSMNALSMIDSILAESDLDILNGMGIPKKAHKKFLKKMAANRMKVLRIKMPPSIDAEAMKIFCN